MCSRRHGAGHHHRAGRRLRGLLALAAGLALAAASPPPLEVEVRALLAREAPGARFGLVVIDGDGRELMAIAPDERFIPASNTKLVTTAAALETFDVASPDAASGAAVRLEPDRAAPDVVLVGHGDARLSSRADCRQNCLTALADAVAAATRRVDDVIGDDSLWPDRRWSPGMSWNNMPTRSGTAISALTLDDNEIAVTVSPGVRAVDDATGYYRIDNRVRTVTAGETAIEIVRLPGSRIVQLHGVIAADAPPEIVRLGIDNPAHYAAWRLRTLLRERGVRVGGDIQTRHRPPSVNDEDEVSTLPPGPTPLARLVPPPLAGDIVTVSKASQNVHAELLSRRIGLRTVGAVLDRAGLPRAAWSFADGSGMSTYNRITPRAMAKLLRWGAARPWYAAWRSSWPVAGVDGTLRHRFRGTPLEAKLFAKTGTLNATNALAGTLVAASGRELTFAAYANDVPDGIDGARAIDAALLVIAAQH